MNTLRPPLFGLTNSEGYLRFLEEHGYAVINNILSQDEMKNLYDDFCKVFKEVSPKFDINDTKTWSIETIPIMFAKGMASFSGLAHSDFMWDLRLHKNIIGIFENIHKLKKDELVVSFDGFSFFFDKKQKTVKPWWHTDQQPGNKTYSVQGAYNFFEVDYESAGFTVVPGSHKKEIKTSKPLKTDWVPIEDPELSIDGVKLIIPENCFVIWNSRTIHANIGMTYPEKRFDRLTCYITYLPKSLRTEGVLKEKIDAYKNADTTSHWANRCEIKKYPWGFGPQYEKKNFNRVKPKLTEDGEIPPERLEKF